jgi:hypothetical protein
MKVFYEVFGTIFLSLILGWSVWAFGPIHAEMVLVLAVIGFSIPAGIFIVMTSDYFFGKRNYERDKQTE